MDNIYDHLDIHLCQVQALCCNIIVLGFLWPLIYLWAAPQGRMRVLVLLLFYYLVLDLFKIQSFYYMVSEVCKY